MTVDEMKIDSSSRLNIFPDLMNYIGQIRLYSLADLTLFLVAAQADSRQLAGSVILWFGFLALLEFSHRHPNRAKMPALAWIFLFVIGFIFMPRLETGIFIILSYLYTLKKQSYFGIVTPLIRGAQMLFLFGAITGFSTLLPWLVFGLISLRNFLGDMRDVQKDRQAKMHTLPIVLGFQRDWRLAHLFGVLITSAIAWNLVGLSFAWLIVVYIIEAGTYFFTPR